VGHTYTTCHGAPDDFIGTFLVPVYDDTPRANPMPWDTKTVSRYEDFFEGGRFLTGLLPLALLRAKNMGLQVVVRDRRKWPTIPDQADLRSVVEQIPGFEHRGYQYAAVDALVRKKRGMWAAATAAGKTTMLGLAHARLQLPTLVLTPPARKDIAVDTVRFYQEVMGLPARLCDGKLEDAFVSVACAALVLSRLTRDPGGTREWLSRFQLVALDECHELSEGLHQILSQVGAPYRVFMTGTPNPRNMVRALRMMGHSGPVIHRATIKELVQQGYVAQPVVLPLVYWQPEGMPGHLEYQEVYRELVVDSERRNFFVGQVVRVLRHFGHTVLVTSPWKQHCYTLGESIDGAVVYTGDQPTKEREVIRQRAREGELKVIVGNSPAEVGISIPAITAIVVVGAGKAPCLTIQRVGRGMRLKEGGGDWLLVVDLVDMLGPTASWDSSTKGITRQAVKRRNLYLAEGMKVLRRSDSLKELMQVAERYDRR